MQKSTSRKQTLLPSLPFKSPSIVHSESRGAIATARGKNASLFPGFMKAAAFYFRKHNKKGDLGDLGMIPLPKIGDSGSFSL